MTSRNVKGNEALALLGCQGIDFITGGEAPYEIKGTVSISSWVCTFKGKIK
jgi:hypothetical protein